MQFDNTILKHLVPIKQLQNEHQLQMARHSQMIALRAGDELFVNEEHLWFVYLIEGKLNLLETDHESVLLEDSTEQACYPLFNEGSNKIRIIAQSASIIARFDRHLFNSFVDEELTSGDELQSVEASEVEGHLFNEIMRAFNAGNLKLPSLPDIAIKVKKALSRPNSSAQDVSRIVSADPAMVTRLINIANGPLNRGVDPIGSIHGALVRLGLQNSKDLIISFSIKQLFMSKSKILNQRLQELYDSSVDVAAISFALSKQSAMLAPDHIMLAGLLHEIGVIPILSYIEDTGLVVTDENELNSIIKNLRGVVGGMVIKHWGLSNDLIAVVENFENWQRQEDGEIDTCDMIIIAQIYHRLKHQQIEGLPKINDVPAFKKLYPENQDANFAQNIFQQAHDEITAIMRLLKR